MTEDGLLTATKRAGQVLDRFSKFKASDMDRFIGRLIGAGMEKPALLGQVERALHKLESDPGLKKCWKDAEGPQAGAGTAQ